MDVCVCMYVCMCVCVSVYVCVCVCVCLYKRFTIHTDFGTQANQSSGLQIAGQLSRPLSIFTSNITLGSMMDLKIKNK